MPPRLHCAAGVCRPGDLSCTSFHNRLKSSLYETWIGARQVGHLSVAETFALQPPQYICPHAKHCPQSFPSTVAPSSLSSRPGTGARTRHHLQPPHPLHPHPLLQKQRRPLFRPPPLLPSTQPAAAQTLAAASRIALGVPSSSRSFGTLAPIRPLETRLALLLSIWCLAVRADLEADVALDLVFTSSGGFGRILQIF